MDMADAANRVMVCWLVAGTVVVGALYGILLWGSVSCGRQALALVEMFRRHAQEAEERAVRAERKVAALRRCLSDDEDEGDEEDEDKESE